MEQCAAKRLNKTRESWSRRNNHGSEAIDISKLDSNFETKIVCNMYNHR